ncbi:hypothetical protein GCM10010168_63970 [Actinoplanes ianthinogenes]|uniref:Aminoglycoside phosphotransferase n=1 Tax=Actinoplanes ianthinogenes TaxID=122358 RepID=A0ABM7LJC8_9ACTN|nr:aminoglycoside phosphotransferase [Actinoplanes ianthinogenes]BCJ39355.1 hypothetical protein Aiant_00120 [Actinoplanes ianthinogenes]GGR36683.1 hypothetical protein GCM10010168_63970 [Actinoplanes ianthinogenes]
MTIDRTNRAALTRPRLAAAPESVRAAVSDLLGAPIGTERPAPAGFTRSIASVVEGGGSRLFVKAAPIGDGSGAAVAAGAALADVVGDLGPRLVGFRTVDDWQVAAYEVVEGETVTRWTEADLTRLLPVVARMRDIMDPCPIGGTSPYAEAFLPLLGTWQALARSGTSPARNDNSPVQDDNSAARTSDSPVPVDHLRGLSLPADVPVGWLAELESRWPDVLADGTALHHGDLRRDNVIREPGGRLRIVDWTHLWTAPGWLDLVRLAPDLAACGHDPETLLRRSAWRDAPDDGVNVALAGLAGRAWREGLLPEVPGLPGLRHMQREQGLHLLRWLSRRWRRSA